jgi:hypothetical protein
MTGQYLVTVQLRSANAVTEQLRRALTEGLSADFCPQIQGQPEVRTHATRWGAPPDPINCEPATFVTCRLIVRVDRAELDQFKSSLQRRIEEIAARYGRSEVRPLDCVSDPMAARSRVAAPSGLAAATNQIVCQEPPYVR